MSARESGGTSGTGVRGRKKGRRTECRDLGSLFVLIAVEIRSERNFGIRVVRRIVHCTLDFEPGDWEGRGEQKSKPIRSRSTSLVVKSRYKGEKKTYAAEASSRVVLLSAFSSAGRRPQKRLVNEGGWRGPPLLITNNGQYQHARRYSDEAEGAKKANEPSV
jgi:hypothetical protein